MTTIKVIHKIYIPALGPTRSYCRVSLSNGKFISAIGKYADILNQFKVHALTLRHLS